MKLRKLRADMLFLLLAPAQVRLIVLTEKDMYDLCMREKKNGRAPREIEFAQVEIPEDLKRSLLEAKKAASREARPEKA